MVRVGRRPGRRPRWRGADPRRPRCATPALIATAAVVRRLSRAWPFRSCSAERLGSGALDRERRPLVNVPASLVVSAALIVACLRRRPRRGAPSWAARPARWSRWASPPCSLGFFVLVARRRPIFQIVGLLLIDNGIALVAFLVHRRRPVPDRTRCLSRRPAWAWWSSWCWPSACGPSSAISTSTSSRSCTTDGPRAHPRPPPARRRRAIAGWPQAPCGRLGRRSATNGGVLGRRGMRLAVRVVGHGPLSGAGGGAASRCAQRLHGGGHRGHRPAGVVARGPHHRPRAGRRAVHRAAGHHLRASWSRRSSPPCSWPSWPANVGVLWVAVEATTVVTTFLVGHRRTKGSLEASWKYIVICSVGIALAFLGTVLVYLRAPPRRRALGRRPRLDLAHGQRPTPRPFGDAARRSRSWSSATAPRWAWPPCTAGCPTPTARRRPRSRPSCPGCCSPSPSTPSCASRPSVDLALGPGFARTLLVIVALLSLGRRRLAAAHPARLQADARLPQHRAHGPHRPRARRPASRSPSPPCCCTSLGHGLAKSVLFLTSGEIMAAEGTSQIDGVRALLARRPALGGVFGVGLLALLGLPAVQPLHQRAAHGPRRVPSRAGLGGRLAPWSPWWSSSSPSSATPATCSSARRRPPSRWPRRRAGWPRRSSAGWSSVRLIGVFAWPLSGLLQAAAHVVAAVSSAEHAPVAAPSRRPPPARRHACGLATWSRWPRALFAEGMRLALVSGHDDGDVDAGRLSLHRRATRHPGRAARPARPRRIHSVPDAGRACRSRPAGSNASCPTCSASSRWTTPNPGASSCTSTGRTTGTRCATDRPSRPRWSTTPARSPSSRSRAPVSTRSRSGPSTPGSSSPATFASGSSARPSCA